MRITVWLLLAILPTVAIAQRRQIDWATFAVERQSFEADDESGKYATTGIFDGVGMLYFSPSKNKIEYKGFRAIRIPFLGQDSNDKFEIRAESFATTSVISVGDGAFAFEGVVDGPFERVVTGVLKIAIGDLGVAGTAIEFRMDEHGEIFEGVMTRYMLPSSPTAKAMLKRYDDVFWGGNFVALQPPQ